MKLRCKHKSQGPEHANVDYSRQLMFYDVPFFARKRVCAKYILKVLEVITLSDTSQFFIQELVFIKHKVFVYRR